MTENKNKREYVINELHNWYVKHHDQINNAISNHEMQLDRMVFTLSTGAIAVTVAFYDALTTNVDANLTNLLKISWVFYLFSIFSIVVGYKVTVAILNEGQRRLQQWQETYVEKLDKGILEFPKLKSHSTIVTDILHYASLISMSVGVVLSMCFVYLTF